MAVTTKAIPFSYFLLLFLTPHSAIGNSSFLIPFLWFFLLTSYFSLASGHPSARWTSKGCRKRKKEKPKTGRWGGFAAI